MVIILSCFMMMNEKNSINHYGEKSATAAAYLELEVLNDQ